MVIPVGVAWEKSLQRHPKLRLHEPDKTHPMLAGTYLAACAFYATLLNQSPLNLPAEALSEIDGSPLQQIATRVGKITAAERWSSNGSNASNPGIWSRFNSRRSTTAGSGDCQFPVIANALW